MKFMPEGWFEFKGIRSDSMGIRVLHMAERTIPQRRIKRKPVTGKNGTVSYGDFTYGDAYVSIPCDALDSSIDMCQIVSWLTGEGELRFSDEPGFVYDASIEEEYTRTSISALMTGQRATIKWTCYPFRKLYPEPAEIILTSAKAITNPGTAPSLPKVAISGYGDFSLTIGMQTIFFYGIENGIIVDSELMDAISPDGSQLLNNQISGDPFEIQPGYNYVSWRVESGSITAVKITPRWRYL